MAADNSIGLNADFGPLKKSIDSLITSLGQLDKTLTTVQQSSSVFDKLFGNTVNFDNFVKSINNLGKITTDSFGVLARGLSDLARAFKEFPTNFNAAGFSAFTTSILDFFTKLQGLNITLTKDQVSTLQSIGGVLRSIASLAEVKVQDFTIKPETITSLQLLIQTVSGVPQNAPGQVGILGKVINGVKGLFSVGAANVGNQNFDLISNGLLSFSRAIKNLNSDIGNVDVKQIVVVFTKLAGALQIVSFILSKLPGSTQIEEFSKTFQRLGIGLSGIARGVEGINNEAIIKLVKTLAILGGAIKIISSIVRFGNDKNAEAFSKILSGVISALVELNKISSFKNQTRSTVSIGGQLKFITSLIGAFRQLKGAQIPDISNTIKAITEAFKLFNTDVTFNEKSIQTFEKFVDRMIKSLQKLNSIKIDTAKAVAIGQQVEALSKFPNISAQLEGIQRSINFSNFLQAVPLVISGVKSIISAFLHLDDIIVNALKNAGSQLNSLGNTLITQGTRLLRSFSLESLTQSGGFDLATQFESLSKQLEVFGRLTKDQVKSAQAFADTIGIKYPLSANDALQATLDLIKAGQSLDSTLKILPSAADLASLSDTKDIKATTAALIAAEGAFTEFSTGVEGSFENISKAADILAAGADVSTASIDSLSEGLAHSATAANLAGLNYEDTVAALAILDKAQLKGERGGRGLTAALNSIFTKKSAKDEFKKLGIAIFDTEGNIRSFDSILKDLNARFKGLSQKQIVDSLGNISDTFGRTALSVLTLNNGLSDTKKEMNKNATAFDKAQVILDTFAGDTQQLKGSFETLLKDVFIPMIDRAFRPFVQVLRQVTDFILRLPQPIKEAASTFIFLAASITTLIGGLSIGLGVLAKLSGVFLTISANAIDLIFNFQKLIVIIGAFGVSLLVVVPVLLALTTGFAVLSEAISSAFRQVEENVGGAGDAFERLRKSVVGIFAEISRIIVTAGQTIQFSFTALFGQTDEKRGSDLAKTFNTITTALNGFLQKLKSIDTTQIVSFFIHLRFGIEDFVNGFLNTIKLVSASVGDFIGPIRDAVDVLLPVINDLVHGIANIFQPLQVTIGDNDLVNTLSGIIKFIRNVIVGQINFLTGLLQGFNDFFFKPLVENIPKIVDGLGKFVNFIVTLFAPVASFIQGVGQTILNFFSNFPKFIDRLKNLNFSLIDLSKFGGSILNGLISIIKGIPQALAGALQKIGLLIGSSFLFFIGKGIQTGDFSAFVINVAKAIQTIALGIFQLIADFGRNIGDLFLENFGLSLKQGDIGQIINSFFDLVSNFILSSFVRVASFLGNAVRFIIQSIFGDAKEEIQKTFLQSIGDTLTTLVSPISFALGVLRKALDLGSIGFEIATTFVRAFTRTFLDLIPNVITIVASSLQDGVTKSLLLGFAAAVKQIVAALAGILVFPLQFIQSAFNFLGAFLDLLDKIGITKGPVLAAIVALISHISGLDAAIVKFAKDITLSVIRPAIQAIQTLILSLTTFAEETLISAKAAISAFVLSIKEAFTGALVTAAKIGSLSIDEVSFSLGKLAGSSFRSIVTGLRSVATGIKALIDAVAPLLTVVALFTELKGVIDALTASANGLPFLRTFIQSVGDSLLSLVGLDQLIPRFHEGLNLLQGLLEAFAQSVGNVITQIFVKLLQGFNDLRARLEKASSDLGLSPESKFAKQFFQVGDLIYDAGALGGKKFFEGLNSALSDPADLNALKSQLFISKDVIVTQFKSLIDPNTGRFLAETTSDQLKQIGNAIEQSGAIPEALQTVNKSFREEIALFNTFSPEAQSANFATFFNNLIKAGIDKTSLDLEPLRDRIIAELGKGTISQDQASKFLDALGFSSDAVSAAAGELGTRFDILSKSFDQLFAEAQKSTLDDLNQQLKDGKISADDYNVALNDLGGQIVTTIEKIQEEKIAALTKQFDEGSISEAEYRKQFEALNKEAQATKLSALQDEIKRVAAAAQDGSISFETAGKQIKNLTDQINSLQPATPKIAELQTELGKLFEDFGAKAISAAKFAEEFQRITAAIEEAKNAAGTTPGGNTAGGGGLADFFSRLFDTINAGAASTQQNLTDLTNQNLQLQQKQEDFARNEARKLSDDIREEEKANDAIDKIKTDAQQKEADDLAKFQLDQQRTEEDHQKKLLEIARTGNDAFNDAIAGRDASAAQAAQKTLRDSTRQENDQFNTTKQRAQQDFDIQRAAAARERDAKILEAQQSLQDLIDKNTRERAQRLEDEQIDEKRMLDKNSQLASDQQTADDAEIAAAKAHQSNLQVAFVNGVAAIEGAVRNGLPGVTGLFTTAFVNLTNQLAQIAGIQTQIQQQPVFHPANVPGQQLPNRAKGGSVTANKPYHIADGKNPEIYTDSQGNSYLLPSRSGFIIPAPQQRQMAGAGGNVNIDIGGININGANQSPVQIASAIEQMITGKLKNALESQMSGKRKL